MGDPQLSDPARSADRRDQLRAAPGADEDPLLVVQPRPERAAGAERSVDRNPLPQVPAPLFHAALRDDRLGRGAGAPAALRAGLPVGAHPLADRCGDPEPGLRERRRGGGGDRLLLRRAFRAGLSSFLPGRV